MKTHSIILAALALTSLTLSSCISIESHPKPASTTVTRETVPANGMAQTTQTTTRSSY